MTNVFCIPFSGGSKYSFNSFMNAAPEQIKVTGIELPGRGSRVDEKLITDIHQLTDDVFSQIKQDLDKPYLLYGHSMGARVAYLLTVKILKENLNPPLHLFVSGAPGPSKEKSQTIYHDLPRAEFIEALKDLGGSRPEFLEDEELFNFFEPIIRADFKVVDTYAYSKKNPFDIPITVMIGKDEAVSYKAAKDWQLETTAVIDIHEFVGNHFFIFNHVDTILDLMSRKLYNHV